mgnify:CR=1 FL=1
MRPHRLVRAGAAAKRRLGEAAAAGDPVTRAAALAALGDAENFGDSK